MDKEKRTVLVPVDFKSPSGKALEYAFNVAQINHDELVLLYVVETPGWLAEFFKSGDELVKIVDDAKEKLQERAKQFQQTHPKVKYSTRVVRGKPYQQILKIARELDVEYIVLGENHQGSEKEKELGSTVYHVTLKSCAPVFIYKGERVEIARRMMVPVDLTKESTKKLDSALDYAIKYGAEVHLVSALVGGIKVKQSRIYKKLKKAKKHFTDKGITCDTQIFARSDKPPYEHVLEYAKEIHADLILIMTHQEGATYDNYIGAFAHHIINQSTVPILSFTATASNMSFSHMMSDLVDPAGIFKKTGLDSN
ncbi:MAG: universal stress protein [Bacteroidota bacterium]|jgi:nucleotide-binding universal stress UspA family protein